MLAGGGLGVAMDRTSDSESNSVLYPKLSSLQTIEEDRERELRTVFENI